MTETPTLAVCFTVWNRGDLFDVSFKSLMGQLDGVNVSVWIIDNGSDAATKKIIAGLHAGDRPIFKLTMPGNMGIPHAANIFARAAVQDCLFAGHSKPDFTAIFDSDMLFKYPIRPLIDVLAANPDVALISGHDSVEHAAESHSTIYVNGVAWRAKSKTLERGCFFLMRTETLMDFIPLNHSVPTDLDWELMHRHPKSLLNTGRKLLCFDASVHLGLFDSTWHPDGVPASAAQVSEIRDSLIANDLMTPERHARMQAFVARHQLASG